MLLIASAIKKLILINDFKVLVIRIYNLGVFKKTSPVEIMSIAFYSIVLRNKKFKFLLLFIR